MLRDLVIFFFCVQAVKAIGEFTVLSTPESLSFEGTDYLRSNDVGEVLWASLGNAVSGDSRWSGLTIVNPFNLPKSVVVVSLEGVERSKISEAGKTYSLQDSAIQKSLNGVSAQLEADNEPVCDINFKQYEEGVIGLKNIIGDIEIPSIPKTKYLNSGLHTADKEFLKTIAYINNIADNLMIMQKLCNFISVRLSLDIAKAHGDDSDAIREALILFSNSVKNLNTAAQNVGNNETLVVAIVNKADRNSRSKREVDPANEKKEYNLAEYYSEDYPVIFNIILWFMVVFGFALLAICYAIGSMDPGRDSIIYRMTSTRMKKDN